MAKPKVTPIIIIKHHILKHHIPELPMSANAGPEDCRVAKYHYMYMYMYVYIYIYT